MNTTLTPITDQADIRDRILWATLTEPLDTIATTHANSLGINAALAAVLNPTYSAQDATHDAETTITAADLTRLRTRTPLISTPRAITSTIDRALATMDETNAVMIDAPSVPALADLGTQAPATLWVRGNLAALTNPVAISITGARAATGYGEHQTHEFATHLALRGATIHSGLGYGIDGQAHRSALAAGGSTVAWLPCGIDRIYPAGHTQLANAIATGQSALVSETAPGTTPTRWRFQARQRLLAAATPATLIIEAGYRSGSLTTAAHALTLGRHVAAIPGPLTSPASEGCHRLIKDHQAALTTTPSDLHPHLTFPTA